MNSVQHPREAVSLFKFPQAWYNSVVCAAAGGAHLNVQRRQQTAMPLVITLLAFAALFAWEGYSALSRQDKEKRAQLRNESVEHKHGGRSDAYLDNLG